MDPLLIVILGPTGSGKTALSLSLAERLGGEIVSCDSVAVYRDFEIGTAKPSKQDRKRLPHYLIDVVSPSEEFTAGDYARMAREVLEKIKARGSMPIVVGGTGLYLRALLQGLFDGPPRSEQLRIRLRRKADLKTIQHLHRVLARLDPDAAKRIHPNDTPKLIRAIEVCLLAGERLTAMWDKGREPLSGFQILRIGLEPSRELLYERINERCAAMFAEGLIEETQRILRAYQSPDAIDSADPRPVARALGSLGYRQAVQHLRGELSLDNAVLAAQQAHRNYAKRQLTWFRREPDVRWFTEFGDAPGIAAEVENWIAQQVAPKMDPAADLTQAIM